MPNNKFYYSVDIDTSDDADLAGLFDMMRYDNIEVYGWDHRPTGKRSWTLQFATKDHPATIERWSSFGLIVRGEKGTIVSR